jgi:hypothetical protein
MIHAIERFPEKVETSHGKNGFRRDVILLNRDELRRWFLSSRHQEDMEDRDISRFA